MDPIADATDGSVLMRVLDEDLRLWEAPLRKTELDATSLSGVEVFRTTVR